MECGQKTAEAFSTNGTGLLAPLLSDRDIPSSNIDLHYVHCSRNLEKCKVCGEMVPKKYAEEHFLSTHVPVSCSLCSETMEREVLAVHKGENFPQRIVTCEFCEFPLPAVDLLEHQELCGNRIELCNLCSRYIRLRERISHESRCNGVPNILVESSSIEGVLILFLQNEVKGSTLTYLKTKIMRS